MTEFQAVWDFADDDPVGGGVASTFSMYLHRRSYFLVFLFADLFMCADTSYFLGFCHWEDLGLRDLMKVVKLHTMFVANPSSVLAATQTPGEAGKKWLQGVADYILHGYLRMPRRKTWSTY
ncbi:uncharacterized protein LOC131301489 [Rhododendron vialii]|uniref:uncharacterized protein LOC131301489 n=1 Tax=Rhododendron vialii TaxID=182163 RepID=UPI00265D734C|nr:uncharacterized protein LOC131301489 [Rhododendron vialii]